MREPEGSNKTKDRIAMQSVEDSNIPTFLEKNTFFNVIYSMNYENITLVI